MRVARGMLRLWLVLSVLWIGSIGAVTWLYFPVEDASGKATGCAPSIPPDICAELMKDDPPIVRVMRSEHLWWGVSFALIPPMFLLALGASLGWAFRGFRREG